ncbi:hypothetical protein [Nocardiopsis nanhaiensis]
MGVQLLLDGLRLGVESPEAGHVEHVITAMGAACERLRPGPDPNWSLRILPGRPVLEDSREWPLLELRPGGPALTITGNQDGRLRAVGYYRPQSAPVTIEVDQGRRLTRLVVSSTYTDQTHWSAWLSKIFFASRLSARGWRMLHASAVVLGGVAVLFVAAPGGGKSTLAHRACQELGAAFLADDLVMIGPDGTVVGWPTRVCLPHGLNTPAPAQIGRMVGGPQRRRLVLSLAEHHTLGFTHAPPTPLGAVVHVRSGPGPVPSCRPWTVKSSNMAEASATDIPVQRLYTSDLLGLTGGAPTLPPTRGEKVFTDVGGFDLTIPDPAALPTAPVWETLSAAIPPIAGVRS